MIKILSINIGIKPIGGKYIEADEGYENDRFERSCVKNKIPIRRGVAS